MPYSQAEYEVLRNSLQTKLLYAKSDAANAENVLDGLADPADFFDKLADDQVYFDLIVDHIHLLRSHAAWIVNNSDWRILQRLEALATIENPPIAPRYAAAATVCENRQAAIEAAR